MLGTSVLGASGLGASTLGISSFIEGSSASDISAPAEASTLICI